MWNAYVVDNRACYELKRGNSDITFIWPFYPHRGNELEHMEEVLEAEGPDEFTIVAVRVEDWNRELSPWQAPAMDGAPFPGEGRELLRWIDRNLRQLAPEGRRILMGYSLAGLFAVWGLIETDLFDGALSASGSFWIAGWQDYLQAHQIRRRADVYLSLGGKEEKTSNPRMKTVGDRTRELAAWMKAAPMVDHFTLEMNSGGHFADSARRLVKGIWFLFGA